MHKIIYFSRKKTNLKNVCDLPYIQFLDSLPSDVLKYLCGHRQVTGKTHLLNENPQPGLSPVIYPSKKQVVSNLGSYIFVQFGNICQHLKLFS